MYGRAGGGYVSHDEALTAPYEAVAQLALGRAALRRAVGGGGGGGAGEGSTRKPPTVLYQIDNFGHSAATPVLASGFGYEHAVINRLPWGAPIRS